MPLRRPRTDGDDTAGLQRPAAPAGPAAAECMQFGEMLVGRNVLTAEQAASLLKSARGDLLRFGEGALIAGAHRADVAGALGEMFDLPVHKASTVEPDPAALALVPDTIARTNAAIPMTLEGDVLRCLTADPTRRASVESAVANRVTWEIVDPATLLTMLDRVYRADSDIEQLVKGFESVDMARFSAIVEDDTDDAPVVQLVTRIVAQALRDRASDVHVEPLNDTLRIRFRIDGTLVDAFELPLGAHPALVSRLKIVSGMNIVERRRPQDGQFSTVVDGRELDIRVASVNTIFGEKMVLRLLDKSKSTRGLADLGMPVDTYETFTSMAHAPFGMIICAGPTGAGKTTTLYATLLEVNEGGKNVTTIEDPVEYVFPGINQIQTNEGAGVTFAHGLKALLRQDPDVILVGEIRDADTARIAVQAALTGHMVLSSLHGTDSVAALHRLLDMGIESFLIASSVVGIVGQRLLRRICSSCREPYTPSLEELTFYDKFGGSPKREFFRGAGCTHCAGTGYRDRIGVYELLRITPELRRLIVGWATTEELRRLAVAQGMRTMLQEALGLVEQDITTIPEVIRTLYAS
jgi:type IV pilus assembly protein PilB